MTTVYSAVSTKGGTGKTSVIKHLAYILAKEKQQRVLIIDLCQNSDIATRLGYDRYLVQADTYDWVTGALPFEDVVIRDDFMQVDFIPASARVDMIMEFVQKKRQINQEWFLKERIDTIKHLYDYILIDTHPSETNRLFIFALLSCDVAIIPTIMDGSSVEGTERTIQIVDDLKSQGVPLDYLVVPHAVDFTKGFRKELVALIGKFNEMGIRNIASPIRSTAVVGKSSLNNVVLDVNNKYIKELLKDYRIVESELNGLMVK